MRRKDSSRKSERRSRTGIDQGPREIAAFRLNSFSASVKIESMEKTYHIITIGCQMNKSDSERIANYLESLGYSWTDERERADVVVTTTCGVRQSAEDRIYGLVPRIKRSNPKGRIILTGCLSRREDVRRRLEEYVDIWMPITELPDLAAKLGKKGTGSLSGYLKINPKYGSNFSAFVPIGNGCDNFCTYCVVPYARGRETYRPAEDVIREAEGLIKKGYKEIILIAQNVNSYKDEKGMDFPDLLRAVNDIEGDFWLRFATSHPKDMSNKLIGTIAGCAKLCQHVHLPAQAGDDEVLRRMNRKYTKDHYLKLIEKIRAEFDPKLKNRKSFVEPISITTDIIVGFPGETKEQFQETARLFRAARFDMAYIAQYSPRPGTASAKMEDDVCRKEKKRREEELMKILRKTALVNNKIYQGKIVEVLFDKKNQKGIFGKTRANKTVRCDRDAKAKIGEIARVKILKIQDFGLEGKIIDGKK